MTRSVVAHTLTPGLAGAGSDDFVRVPAHGMHAFRTPDGDELVRFLILFVPGPPRERYFRGLAEFGQR